jgi:hypothetical protein
MRRVTALAIATGIALSASAMARPAPEGYYVIRWDNTGVCQIWNDNLNAKLVRWPSDYKVVSRPVPTFTGAVGVQEKLRAMHRCTV